MSRETVKVLLLGESEKGSSYLAWHLEHHGCLCWFAKSTDDASPLFDTYKFQLVLSSKPLDQADAMIARLGESNCNLFCCYPAEESCWWLPVLANGKECRGEPALRPSEFVSALGQIVSEIAATESERVLACLIHEG
jgi:hypothetical protein